MNSIDESLLKELESSLDDKVLQKAVLVAYIKKPDNDAIVAAVLAVLEKATPKK